MRRFGTILIVIGAFVMISAVLALLGPTLEAGGINVSGFVTSVPGALLTGAALLFFGALLRRRALAKNQENS
ncbi:MAG: hypothetical protein M3O61_02295 [Gemmatimonadota bacterium]|nr:hypothetical protein [Gemmatimonadota bacterium]